MLYLIYDNQVVGTTSQSDSLPHGYTAVEGPSDLIENLYYENGQIKVRGTPQPQPAPTTITRPPQADWSTALIDLQNTAVFKKAFATKDANAFSMLVAVFTTTHNLENLAYFVGLVRAGLYEDFTAEEIAEFNAIMDKNHIDFNL